jgi:hypothetical protein
MHSNIVNSVGMSLQLKTMPFISPKAQCYRSE